MVLAPQDSQQHDNPPTLALAMALSFRSLQLARS